jgi:hypothetical protein
MKKYIQGIIAFLFLIFISTSFVSSVDSRMIIVLAGGGAACSQLAANTTYSCIIEDKDSDSSVTDEVEWTTNYCGEPTSACRDTKFSTRVYDSIYDWEAARDGASSSGQTEYAEIHGTWTNPEDNWIRFLEWTSGALITIKTFGDAKHDGGWDTTAYRLVHDSAINVPLQLVIDTGESLTIEIDGIQVASTWTSAPNEIIQVSSGAASPNATIRNSLIGGWDGGNIAELIDSNCDRSVTIKFINSVFDPALIGGSATATRIFLGETDGTSSDCTIEFFNSVITNASGDGFLCRDNVVNIHNSFIFNTADDLDGCDTMSNNACDDGDASCTKDTSPTNYCNSSCTEAQDWGTVFTDYANSDFTLTSNDCDGTNCDDWFISGLTNADDSDVPTTDILGNARRTSAGLVTNMGVFEAGGCPYCTSAQYDVLKETSDEDDANFGAQCSNCVDNPWTDGDDSNSLDLDYDASALGCGFSDDAWRFTAGAGQDADAWGRFSNLGPDLTWYVSFYFYLDDISGLGNAQYIRLAQFFDDGGVGKGNLNILDTSGTRALRFSDCDNGVAVIYSGLNEDTPYRVDARMHMSSTVGYNQARLYYWDGSAWTELTSGWTGNDNLDCSPWTNGWDRLDWGVDVANVLDEGDAVIFDCLMIDDDTAQY